MCYNCDTKNEYLTEVTAYVSYLIGSLSNCSGDAYFPFVNGRCHLKRSLPFETVDVIFLALNYTH